MVLVVGVISRHQILSLDLVFHNLAALALQAEMNLHQIKIAQHVCENEVSCIIQIVRFFSVSGIK